jgi:DNA-directed RNA polymerase alpha subunit
MTNKWEEINVYEPHQQFARITTRLKVIGGWLVNELIRYDLKITSSMAFIPDINHSWNKVKIEEKSFDAVEDVLHKFIYQVGVSKRTAMTLRYDDIYSVKDLLKRSESDLLKLSNLGPKTLKEIKNFLMANNLQLSKTPYKEN